MHLDDAAVVARVRDGDEDAFRLLVDRHGRAVYRVAYRMTGRKEDAEDVVQETFVKVYRQIGQFQSRANFGTWLHRIAFNCAIDLIRTRPSREQHAAPEVLDALAGHETRPGTDELVFASEIGARVQHALGSLSAQERAAFLLRHEHGCSIEEICEALDVKANAAKHAVFRGVRKMREALRPLALAAAQRER